MRKSKYWIIGSIIFVQGLLFLLSWTQLVLSPGIKPYLLPKGVPEYFYFSSWIAEVMILGFGSILAALILIREAKCSLLAVSLVAGAATFSALQSLGLFLVVKVGYLETIAKLLSMLIYACAVIQLARDNHLSSEE